MWRDGTPILFDYATETSPIPHIQLFEKLANVGPILVRKPQQQAVGLRVDDEAEWPPPEPAPLGGEVVGKLVGESKATGPVLQRRARLRAIGPVKQLDEL